MKRLFESRKLRGSTAAIPVSNAKTIFTKAPFIQYKQILLDKNFRQHLETTIVSKKILRMGVQRTPIQKTYKICTDQDSLNIDFLGANRQFDWIEFSIVHNKSDKHTSICDSYNFEFAAKTVKSTKLSYFTEIYSLTDEKNYDTNNLTQKYLLYKQFVAWSSNGCSTAPLVNYINNPVYQELTDKEHYCAERSNERLYLDLRASSGYTN